MTQGNYFQERFRKLVQDTEAAAQEAHGWLKVAPDNAKFEEPDSRTKAQRVLDQAIERYCDGAAKRRATLQAEIDWQLNDIATDRQKLREKHLARASKALSNAGLVEYHKAHIRRLVDAKNWQELQRLCREPTDDSQLFTLETCLPEMLGASPERSLFGPVPVAGMAELDDWESEVQSAQRQITRLTDKAAYEIEIERRYGLQDFGHSEAVTLPAAPAPVAVPAAD